MTVFFGGVLARDSGSLIIVQTTWRRNSISHNKVKWMIASMTLACLKMKRNSNHFSMNPTMKKKDAPHKIEVTVKPIENKRKIQRNIHRDEWMKNNKISKIKQNSNSLKILNLCICSLVCIVLPSVTHVPSSFSLQQKYLNFELFVHKNL